MNLQSSFTYGNFGRRTSRTLQLNNTTIASAGRSYDTFSRIASVSNGTDTLSYTYRPGGQLSLSGWTNGQNAMSNQSYEYDQYKRLTGIKLNNVNEVSYTLNAKDQRTAATYANAGLWNFTYDDKGQVTGANGSSKSYAYSYDGIGNRLTANENSTITNYTSNLLNQYTLINNAVPNYDADGNMTTSGNGWTYTYNGENRITQATKGSTTVTMAYDYAGRRISKTVSESGVVQNSYKYVYDGFKLIAVYNNNDLVMTFTWQPESLGMDVPVSMTYAGATYYYVTDGNKNVTALADASGNRVAEYVYGPFGQTVSATGSMAQINPFRFSSEYHNDITGLVEYIYRKYDPVIGRWINRDPIEERGCRNLYVICKNCNIDKFDILGCFIIYIETVEWGHVGINTAGKSYDFGRYAGRYRWSLYSGPNILRVTNGLPKDSNKVTYTKYIFNACDELERAITEHLENKFSSLQLSFPSMIYDKLKSPRNLNENERYHGSDWQPNGWNCITFTFSSLMGGVRRIVDSRDKASARAKRQAILLIQLSARVSWGIGMSSVKQNLELFKSENKDWVK